MTTQQYAGAGGVADGSAAGAPARRMVKAGDRVQWEALPAREGRPARILMGTVREICLVQSVGRYAVIVGEADGREYRPLTSTLAILE